MNYATLRKSNIYEVNIRQYTPEGSFTAFTRRLPQLKNLGVEIIWLMPIHPIGLKNRKGTLGSYYSISNYQAVNPEFGSADDFKNLVDVAHNLGIKVLIDWVANHTSWDNVWTISHPEFFVHHANGAFMAPYDWDDVIQIDHASPEQQNAMIDAMSFWVTNFDIDGFRADLAHLTPLHFWQQAKLKLGRIKQELIWLAETEDPVYHEVFDISYAWDWMHACERYFKREVGIQCLIEVLERNRTKLPADALQLFFTTNHDENSWNGTEFEKFGKYVPALTVFNFTWPGVPLIYSGQEIPNTCRLKFFDKDELDWEKLDEYYATLYTRLNKLRQQEKSITGSVKIINEFLLQDILCYQLENAGEMMWVCLNLGTGAKQIGFTDMVKEGWKNPLAGMELQGEKEDNNILLPGGFRVLIKK